MSKRSKVKIFILVPNLEFGGISNYYNVLKKYLPDKIEYINRGKRSKKELKLFIPFRLLLDYLEFCRKTWFKKNVVIVNTSLGYGGVLRDGIYIMLSLFSYKKIVFFRGWNPNFQKLVDENVIVRFWLQKTFLKGDRIIVLSSKFKSKLREWGYKGDIDIETTVVDESLVGSENWKKINIYRNQLANQHILYLGNIAKQKGVWEVAEALKILKSNEVLGSLNITFAGLGEARSALRTYFDEQDISADFPGYVKGTKKTNVFKDATMFIFVSYHEGMPNAVLEAIAFGLPVVTTPVGGIPEFFEEGKMGLFLENREPQHIAEKILYLLKRPDLMKEMSKFNFNYAKEHFYAGKVVARLDKIVSATTCELEG